MNWDKILKSPDEFYFKSLFWEKISPVSKLSSYIALEYMKRVKENEPEKNKPLFISVPEKNNMVSWLASIILIKKFYNEYCETNGDPRIPLELGKKYSVFGSICKYDGTAIINGKVHIKLIFAKNVIDYIQPDLIRKHLNKVSQDRKLNKVQHFRKIKSELLKKKPALSKILEPNTNIIINKNIFQTKILLVYGRGNKTTIESILKNTVVYGEPLHDIVTPNNNLILNSDLRKYISLDKDDYSDRLNYFKAISHQLINSNKTSEEVRQHLMSIITDIEKNGDIITKEIDEEFLELTESFGNEDIRLQNIKNNYYPGINQENIIEFDTIILNDIYLAEDFKDTIKKFLKKKVPVIVVCNKEINTGDDVRLFSRFFNNNDGLYKNAYRFNWTQNKLQKVLGAMNEEEDYLDKDLMSAFIRFANQVIRIVPVKKPAGPDIDKNLPVLLKKIYELQGFETFKNAIYQILYPLLYLMKNSHFVPSEIMKPVLKKFNEIWDATHFFISNNEIKKFINDVLNLTDSNGYKNTKKYNTRGVFCHKISIPEFDEFFIPFDQKSVRLPSNDLDNIIFTGFPYKEITSKYLINAVTKYLIPKIEIICWPEEARLTYNYLKRRLIASYFYDLVDGLLSLPDEFKVEDNSVIEEEINNRLKYFDTSGQEKPILDESEIQVDVTENIFKNFENMRFEKYKPEYNSGEDNSNYTYIVKSNVVLFDDGCFMFIPENSTVLAQITDDENISIRKLKLNNLTPGMRIYQIKGENISFRNLLKNNKEASEAYKIIDVWKEVLLKLSEKFKSIEELNKALLLYGTFQDNENARPTYHNIVRWLNDEDMIAPNEANLKLIIEAGKKNGFLENFDEKKYDELITAIKYITGLHISLGKKIRESIIKYIMHNRIEDEFVLEIAGTRVRVISKRIAEINEKKIEVEYSYTRKFLC